MNLRTDSDASAAGLQSLLDAGWYLTQYPDVALAGLDAATHYQAYGFHEGRWPCAMPALALETALWQRDEQALVQLRQLLSASDSGQFADRLQAALAALVLAKWYASWGRWSGVATLMPQFFACPAALRLVPAQLPWLLAFSALWQQDLTAAAALLQNPAWPDSPDKVLAQSMIWPVADRPLGLQQIWQQAGLMAAQPWQQEAPPVTHKLTAKSSSSATTALPLISVIVPLYNAGHTIETALCSLLAQSWPALEILVVDDGSTDDSAVRVRQLSARYRQIRLLQQANSGAYVARNLGLRHARGEFITTHDADDWSHPEKLSRQVTALLDEPAAQACVSHWVRATPQLEFQRWRLDDGWVYRNVSSLMFRRQVHHQLGFWDRVAVNADTEFYYRIRQQFGPGAIIEVLPGIPLALGRVDRQSLSQTGLTHLRTMYAGIRRQYHEAALHWQQQSRSLYLTAVPLRRAFAVPQRICRGTPEQQRHNAVLLICASPLFDDRWYCRRYAVEAASRQSAAWHYLQQGAAAGLAPGPAFAGAAYAQQHQLPDSVNPLLHYLAAETDRLAADREFEDEAGWPLR